MIVLILWLPIVTLMILSWAEAAYLHSGRLNLNLKANFFRKDMSIWSCKSVSCCPSLRWPWDEPAFLQPYYHIKNIGRSCLGALLLTVVTKMSLCWGHIAVELLMLSWCLCSAVDTILDKKRHSVLLLGLQGLFTAILSSQYNNASWNKLLHTSSFLTVLWPPTSIPPTSKCSVWTFAVAWHFKLKGRVNREFWKDLDYLVWQTCGYKHVKSSFCQRCLLSEHRLLH